MPFLGIDLGTTNSCVAWISKGKPEVICNDLGRRTTPSIVAFTDQRTLVGESAKMNMSKDPKNCVNGAKRIIGRSYDEPCMESEIKSMDYDIVNCGGKPKIWVQYKNDKRGFFPEQISALILEKLKKTAEDYVGEGVTGAVITVPAYFNDSQRRATLDAARIADLHVIGLINEPTAAAVAYGLEKNIEVKRNVLIFDLGGGTFDVTVLVIHGRDFRVKATCGDSNLGGKDFTNRLYNHFVANIASKRGVDISKNRTASSRLKRACEEAKKALSETKRATIDIPELAGNEFQTHITRERFESLNDDLFRGTMETVETALIDASIKKNDIDEVILIGGSTRIPRIQSLLTEYFGPDKICRTINPDEAVALGAAAYASWLLSEGQGKDVDFSLVDVVPLSLGIETQRGIMSTVVERNATIPVTKKKNFTTVKNDQTKVDFRVYEGERPQVKNNRLLGSFLLTDIPRAPANEPVLEVNFIIGRNGVLEVSATEEQSKNKNSIKITRDGSRMDKREISKMIEEAAEFKQDDEAWQLQMKAMNNLEGAIHDARSKVSKMEYPENHEELLKKCDEVSEWIEDTEIHSLEDVISKIDELQKLTDDI